MRYPETHAVTDSNGPRPAGDPDICFYCAQPIGHDHADDCVCRKRTVVLRYHIDVVSVVPESWAPAQIEFHRNESSWCTSNLLKKLDRLSCICRRAKAEYLREATADDVTEWLDNHEEPATVRTLLGR